MNEKWYPVGEHESIADLTSAVPLSLPDKAGGIVVQAFTENVRYTVDGASNPTSSLGFTIYAGNEPQLINVQGEIRFIEESSGATLQYQFVA